MPKNMLLVSGGESYSIYLFQHLISKHQERGDVIAPNANKVMKDLLGHAQTLGFEDLCAIILEAFDPELRNGYAHADYIIWNNDIRLSKRNGGNPRTAPVIRRIRNPPKQGAHFLFHIVATGRPVPFAAMSAQSALLVVLTTMTPKCVIISFDQERGMLKIQSGYDL